MEKKKKSAKRFMWVAVILMVVSMVGASLVQSSGGKVQINDIRFETTSGYRMSGLLFIPEGVSAENPAPAIVVSHGMYNNREMQDLNFVELSRRGYVVFSMDMISHGNSEDTDNIGTVTTGMYEAVKMLNSLSFVDSSRIGITGHSLGAMSSNVAVAIDNAMPEQLISAVLLNCADATYTDEGGNYVDVYGSRDVGMIAAQYDEFFNTDVDENGNVTPPRDFVKYNNAQSFLHFGTDPAGQDMRQAETMYTQEMDGEEAIRVIYNPEIIHPWSHFSQQSTKATIEFFDAALGAPNPIASTSQVWQWKVVFNVLGLIGVGMFIVSFTVLMVFTPFFSALRAKEPMGPVAVQKGGMAWFWGSLVAAAIFGTVIYYPILIAGNSFSTSRGLVPQSSPWGVGLWAMLCGAFAIVSMVLSYNLYGKKHGFSLADRGVSMSLKKTGKTILLALIVVAVAYGWVFFANYFFKVDFRIWVIAMKAFEADKVLITLFPYVPLFLVYYVANSVAVNSFNYNKLGKKEWVNTLVLAVFNAVPAIVLLLIQYISFWNSGFMLFSGSPFNMYTVWLFPFLVYLPLAAVLSRKIYRVTGNPYLPGIINGLIVAMISCSNTLTWL